MKALATEMTASFGKRLATIGLQVRELTGDTTLSKKEISETQVCRVRSDCFCGGYFHTAWLQMLILTPEKWDVVTRKGSSDNSLTSLVRLLIIDEVCELLPFPNLLINWALRHRRREGLNWLSYRFTCCMMTVDQSSRQLSPGHLDRSANSSYNSRIGSGTCVSFWLMLGQLQSNRTKPNLTFFDSSSYPLSLFRSKCLKREFASLGCRQLCRTMWT